MAEIHIDASVVKAVIGQSTGTAVQKAVVHALNKTIVSVRTQAKRYIADRLGMKQKLIVPHLEVIKATSTRPQATLRITDKNGIPLIEFGAKPVPVQSARGPRIGVTVSLSKPATISYTATGGAKMLIKLPAGNPIVPGAFIAVVRGGRRGIFIRRGYGINRDRDIIGELRFSGLIDVFKQDTELQDMLKRYANETFKKVFQQDYKYYMLRALAGKAK